MTNRFNIARTLLGCGLILLLAEALDTTPLAAQKLFPIQLSKTSAFDTDTAQPKNNLKGADTDQADVSIESPRASLDRYFALTRAGQFDSAVVYLNLPSSLQAQGPELARQLKTVLDRYLWIDLATVSSAVTGDTSDDLPRGVDQLGKIRNVRGIAEPVRFVRWTTDDGTRWRFSRETVERIPGWYDTLSDRWVLDHLPTVLLRTGPLEILWWQWLALPILLILSIIIGYVGGRVAQIVLNLATSRTKNGWDDALAKQLRAPFTALCILIAISALLPKLSLSQPATDLCYRMLRVGVFLIIFWGAWRIVDVTRHVLAHTRWARSTSSSHALLPLGARVTKIVIFAIATVVVFSLLGYRITSLLAGLGLGGLALALAAQKTVENLFGAFSIGVDQPFREGDFVKVADFSGTVEVIGLRSTRFRTLDRTIITLPNGQLADMQVESFAARDRLRLATTIRLVYSTTTQQMRDVLTGFEDLLRQHPKIWPDSITVRLGALSESSLNIDIMAWFQTANWDEFQLIRQNVLLAFMEVVERAGTSFAFPARMVHLVSDHREQAPALPPATEQP